MRFVSGSQAAASRMARLRFGDDLALVIQPEQGVGIVAGLDISDDAFGLRFRAFVPPRREDAIGQALDPLLQRRVVARGVVPDRPSLG